MKKLKKWSILSAIAIILVGALAGCSSNSGNLDATESNEAEKVEISAFNLIKNADKIRIGVFSDKPPFGYVDAEGKNQGFDVYIGKRLAKELLGDEAKAEFILVEAANRVEYLNSNRVDLILANFTVTDERKEKVDFAKPYMKVALGIVSKEGFITNVEELNGKKLIVNRGTTAEAYFTQNHPEIELVKYEQNTEAFAALVDGRGDALAHDNTLLFAWARDNETFSVGIASLGEPGTIAPAVQKGNVEFLNFVNDTLVKLGEEGFIREAYDATLKSAFGDEINPEDVIIEGNVN